MGHGIGSRVLSALLGLVLLVVARPAVAAAAAPTTARASACDAAADRSYSEAALATGSGSARAYQVDHVGHVTGDLLYQVVLVVAADEGAEAGDLVGATCGGESFTADTNVIMADGSTKPLDEVKVGDKVEATDPANGKTSPQKVIQVWVNHDSDLMDVTVKAGGKTSTIHATQKHLFWDVTRHAWTEADRLARGDQMRTNDGALATVAGTVVVPGAADMWDLTVQTSHDFYVVTTTSNILVHNCPVDPRDVHGSDRVGSRGVDVQHVVENGHLYYQEDGQLVRVLDNGNGTSDVVIRDASNPSGQPTTGRPAAGPANATWILALASKTPTVSATAMEDLIARVRRSSTCSLPASTSRCPFRVVER